MDVGGSTGGFTECMLQDGAKEVIAVDTGYGEIAMKLGSAGRVKVLERTNARQLTSAELAQAGASGDITFIAVDVSFISVTLVLPAVLQSAFASPSTAGRELVILVKPQFEVGRENVGKGGIVKDKAAQQGAGAKALKKVEDLNGRKIKGIDSPILG